MTTFAPSGRTRVTYPVGPVFFKGEEHWLVYRDTWFFNLSGDEDCFSEEAAGPFTSETEARRRAGLLAAQAAQTEKVDP